MIRVSNVRSRENTYIVYENEEEWLATGLTVHEPHLAQAGDYIRSDNGYYVPVVQRKEKVGKKGNPYVFFELVLPLMKSVGSYNYEKNSVYHPRTINWERTFKPVDPVKRMTPRHFLFARLIEEGADLKAAFKCAFPGETPGSIKRMLKHKYLMTYLKDIIMSKLSKALDNSGVTYDLIAQTVKDALESGTSKDKQWAVDVAINLIDKASMMEAKTTVKSLTTYTSKTPPKEILPADFEIVE